MRPFILLPLPIRALILILQLIVLAFFCLDIIQLVHEKKWRILPFSVLAFLILLIDRLSISESSLHSGYLESTSMWNQRANEAPHIIHVSLIFLFLILAILRIVQIHISNTDHLNKYSVREALDNLPTGLCFADERGRVILANHMMYETAAYLTGHPLVNEEDFWREMLHYVSVNGIMKMRNMQDEEQNSAVFLFPDERYMKVLREKLMIDGAPYWQITLSDVTAIHELFEQVRKDTTTLSKQREELRQLANRLIQNNHAEEVLGHKMRIHNELGQMIFSTRVLLEKGIPDTPELDMAYDERLESWIQLSNEIASLNKKPQNQDAMMQEILSTAEKIGCEVHVDGEFPEDEQLAYLMRQIVRETVINAVRHGAAERVDIKTFLTEQERIMEIVNDGILPEQPVTPKGGMKNLQESLWKFGGVIEYGVEEKFTVRIRIPLNQG